MLIQQMVATYGPRWSSIASHLPGRTDNAVRNRFWRMHTGDVRRSVARLGEGYLCRACGAPKRGHTCSARPKAGLLDQSLCDEWSHVVVGVYLNALEAELYGR